MHGGDERGRGLLSRWRCRWYTLELARVVGAERFVLWVDGVDVDRLGTSEWSRKGSGGEGRAFRKEYIRRLRGMNRWCMYNYRSSYREAQGGLRAQAPGEWWSLGIP